jgi:flagellum-specific ATP synthase
MMDLLSDNLDWLEERLEQADPCEKSGRILNVNGLVIESEGPEVALGEVCRIESVRSGESVPAEVVGFRENRVLLMPLGEINDLHPGCRVVSSQEDNAVPVGETLLGRVLNGRMHPIDGKGRLLAPTTGKLKNAPPDPMKRKSIDTPFETGVKAIDTFVPLGHGQRVGIFSGSGVGKSVLLGMLARNAQSDVNVIALVGERGREVKDFIEKHLGEEGMRKSVVIVTTSDQPAPLRIRAANLATAIAEDFRNQGKNVMLLMDSVTRLAMAQREIGLAVGEPPTTRGYTPSVFGMLPKLLERSGTGEVGSITAIYTVLVEGDDMNEPVADAVRSILDGHIVLSRKLANANLFPAIDVLDSISRLYLDVCSEEEIRMVTEARDLLAIYRHNEDLINVGAYAPGTNSKIDRAIEKFPAIREFLRQVHGTNISRANSFAELGEILT